LGEYGVYDDTLVILFSDHGEELWEHGTGGHITHAYDETLHVPLLIRLPGSTGPGRRVARQVALSDVFATVLQLLGETVPEGLDAHSLLPLVAPERFAGTYDRKHVVSELCMVDDVFLQQRGVIAEWLTRTVRSEHEKYLRSSRDWVLERTSRGESPAPGETPVESEELYNLENDPTEKSNIVEDSPGPTARLRGLLNTYFQSGAGQRSTEPEPDTAEPGMNGRDVEALRRLGYL